MKKLSTTSLIMLTIVCPSFATVDISKNESNPDCNNTVLHTYDAPTSLEADWNANTIHLNWYLDSDATQPLSTGIQTSAQTCIYDGSITLPTTNPTKTGYTFAGWQVRSQTNIDPVCDQVFIENLLYEKRNSNARVADYDVVFGYGDDMWLANEAYDLTEPGTFAIEYSDGDIAYGTINFWFAPLESSTHSDYCWTTDECGDHISHSMIDDNAKIPDGVANDFLLNNTQMCAFAPLYSIYNHRYGLYFRMTAYKPKDGVKCRITDSGWRLYDIAEYWKPGSEYMNEKYNDGPQTIVDNIDDIADIFRREMGYIEDQNRCFNSTNTDCAKCIYNGGWQDINDLR